MSRSAFGPAIVNDGISTDPANRWLNPYSWKYTGTRPLESDVGSSRSKSSCEPWQKRKQNGWSCVLATRAIRHLSRRGKIYLALRDVKAEKHGMLPIVDEPGEDYLYPKALF